MTPNDDSDPSDSAAQREVEAGMLDRLNADHPNWRRVLWKAAAADLGLPSVWAKAEPDAVWKTGSDELVIAECYARIGKLGEGHKRKLAKDALKLWAIQHACRDGVGVRCLLVIPDELAHQLNGAGWLPAALRLAADIYPVALLENEKVKLRQASILQADGQARSSKRGRRV